MGETVDILRNGPNLTVIMDGPMWSLTLTDINGKRSNPTDSSTRIRNITSRNYPP